MSLNSARQSPSECAICFPQRTGGSPEKETGFGAVSEGQLSTKRFRCGITACGSGEAEGRGSAGRSRRKAVVRPTGRKRAGAEGPPTPAALSRCSLRAPGPRIPAHTFLMRSPWLREGRGSFLVSPSLWQSTRSPTGRSRRVTDKSCLGGLTALGIRSQIT